jgi:transcriptional regulator with XRE-family HTH domain
MPVARSVIANFENGRRASIGVAELMVFSRVLNVPPVTLICPVGYEAEMEILPGVVGDPYAAAFWITGENVPTEDEEDSREAVEQYLENPLPIVRDFTEVLNELSQVDQEVATLRPEAEAKSVELSRAEAEYDYAKVIYEQAREETRVTLEKVKSKEIRYPADGVAGNSSQAYDALMRAMDRYHSVKEPQAKLEQWLKVKADYEKEARDLIDKMRDKGWLLPKLPSDYRYLLESPENDRTARRRSSAVRGASRR